MRLTCGFLWTCSGYYRYDEGYTPEFAGVERFAGPIVHPQHWPEDLDYSGKRVVVIGSGATAVTLVPAMAEQAAHVTMLQRSPTYIASLPAEDPIATRLRRRLPERAAYARGALEERAAPDRSSTSSAAAGPELIKRLIRKGVERSLPAGYDVDKHFKPTLQPVGPAHVPGPRRRPLPGDLARARPRSSPTGSRPSPSAGSSSSPASELEADVIVTATGLNLLFLGGIELTRRRRARSTCRAG